MAHLSVFGPVNAPHIAILSSIEVQSLVFNLTNGNVPT